MATLTGVASQAGAGVQPRAIHAGVNAVYSVYSITATLSVGDIIKMCKIPDGARIVDIVLGLSAAVSDSGKLNIGTAADHDRFIASASCNAANVWRFNGGPTVGDLQDISDAATTRYNTIEIKVSDNATSATGTTSGVISMVVQYQMDQVGNP